MIELYDNSVTDFGKMLNNISIVCYVISAIICFGTDNDDYGLLFLEPFIWGLFYSINTKLQEQKFQSISLGIFFVTTFIRFVCLPLIMCLAGYPNIAVTYCSPYISQAVLLQLYEEICMFLVVHFFSSKYLQTASCTSCPDSVNIFEEKNNQLLWVVIIAGIAVAIAYPALLSRFHFVLALVGNEKEEYVDNAGLGVLIGVARNFFILLTLVSCYKQYLKGNSAIWILISLGIICCNALFINDLSRFGLLMPLATWLYLMYQIYPNIRKRLFSISCAILIALLSFVTYVKAFSKYRGDSDNIGKLDYWCGSLQTYFQGVNDISIGLYASHNIDFFSVSRFINDAISNVAILSHFSDPTQSSLKIFNIVYNGMWVQDKILPNICAGYYYFWFLGAPIISCVFVYMALKFDSLSQRTNSLYYKYLFIYATIICSFSNMIYYTMLISYLVNSVLVMYVLLKLNEKIIIKIR